MNRRMSILEKIPRTRSRVTTYAYMHKCDARYGIIRVETGGRNGPRASTILAGRLAAVASRRRQPRAQSAYSRRRPIAARRQNSALGVHCRRFPHHRSAFHHRKLRPNRNRKRNREYALSFAGSVSFLRKKEKERKEESSLRNLPISCLVLNVANVS